MTWLKHLNPVDKLIAAYLAFVTVMALARLGIADRTTWWIVLAHGLTGCARRTARER
jgi:hypothetical protein